jgi:hypothetical protein
MEYHIHESMKLYQVTVRETRPENKAGRIPTPIRIMAAISKE